MNSYKRQVVSFSLAALVACMAAATAATQTTPDKLTLTIALDKTGFVSPEPIPVRVSVSNDTGKTIDTKSVPVSFHLSKHGKGELDCRFPDCYIASTYWTKAFPSGKTSEVNVALTDLYWNELLSSQLDIRRPRNLYSKVPAGQYSLFLDFHFAKGSVKSNVIVVTISE